MKKLKSIKIINELRFTIFCICITIIVSVIGCLQTNKSTKEKLEIQNKIREDLLNVQVLSEKEQEALERFNKEVKITNEN